MRSQTRPNVLLFLGLFLLFTLLGMLISFFLRGTMWYRPSNTQQTTNKETTSASRRPIELPESEQDVLASAVAVQQALRGIAKRNMKAVVNISTETVVALRNPYSEFFDDDFFRYFFGERQQRQPQKRKQKSLGSGFIVDKDGYLLSNLHVVKNASAIKVRLYDEETEYDAEVVGIDENSDLALLKIKAKREFPFVTLGDSSTIEPGDFAVAIGNPYGLNNTMTLGIISAKGRSAVGANRYQQYIQVDVAINPGNSGGPLFNIYGEVIGVNNMIYSTSGGNIGIGFAIPINLAKNVMSQLREHGEVTRGWLGVYPQDITQELAKALDIDAYSGVYVGEVIAKSPAADAGIEDGDIIVSFNGVTINRANDLYNAVANTEVGAKAKVVILRKGEKKTLTVTVGERPSDDAVESEATTTGAFGITVASITPDLRREYRLREREDGALIIDVLENSKAWNAGLQPGDVIKRVNGEVIPSKEAYDAFMERNEKTKTFQYLIKRERAVAVVTLSRE